MVGTRGSAEPVRVLVVEDDPVARRLLALALRSTQAQQITVHEAASAAEACCLLEDTVFDGAVVSLDGCPEDGIAELRRAGLSGPIAATSRNGSVKVAVEAMRAGADDFLVKPYQPAELVRRLMAKIEERTASVSLVPAKAGTQRWIPACAGMSGVLVFVAILLFLPIDALAQGSPFGVGPKAAPAPPSGISGWILTEQLDAYTLAYKSLYILPGYRPTAQWLGLLQASIKAQLNGPIRWGTLLLNLQGTLPSWTRFCQKHLAPHAQQILNQYCSSILF